MGIGTLWKTVWRFFTKVKIELLYDPEVPLLGNYSKEMRTLTQKDYIYTLCSLQYYLR